MSTVGDIMITLDFKYTGRYHEYTGETMMSVGGYHEHTGGYSAHGGFYTNSDVFPMTFPHIYPDTPPLYS